MLSEERRAKTIEMLKERNFLKVSELIDEFGVSHETVRRDLEELHGLGILKRVHGGAVYTAKGVDPTVSSAHSSYSVENQVVASYAASMVKPGMIIYIDNGRTMTNLASRLKEIPNLTIVTPNLQVVLELAGCSGIDLYLLSGKVDMDEFCTCGKSAEKSFEMYNVEYAFMSCGGLDLSTGNINDLDDFGLSRHVIRKHSDKLVLVLSSGKLNKKYLANLANLRSVDTVIIDSNISEEDEELLRGYVQDVVVVPMDQQS